MPLQVNDAVNRFLGDWIDALLFTISTYVGKAVFNPKQRPSVSVANLMIMVRQSLVGAVGIYILDMLKVRSWLQSRLQGLPDYLQTSS